MGDIVITVTGLGSTERGIGSNGLPHHGDMGTNAMISGVNSGVSLVMFYISTCKMISCGLVSKDAILSPSPKDALRQSRTLRF